MKLTDIKNSLNEISAIGGLKQVVKGNTDRVEGIKLSKEMAQAMIDWFNSSPYGRKYPNAKKGRLNLSLGIMGHFGLDRYAKHKGAKEELKYIKTLSKAMRDNVNEANAKSKDSKGMRFAEAIYNNVSAMYGAVVRENKDVKEVVGTMGPVLVNSINATLKHKFKPTAGNEDKLKSFYSELKQLLKVAESLVKRPSKAGLMKLDKAHTTWWNHRGGAAIVLNGKYEDNIVESLNEGKYDGMLDVIEDLVSKASSFMDVGNQLKKHKVKYSFSTSMMPIYRLDKLPIAIVNKRYVDKADREVGDIAIGLMESIKESKSMKLTSMLNENKYSIIDPKGNAAGTGTKDQANRRAKQLGGNKKGYFVVPAHRAKEARRAMERFKFNFKNAKLQDKMSGLYFDDEMFGESVNEGKFKVDDLVYNKRTKTVGIVRMGDDKYGEVKTDADGNVDVDELEKYNPIKFKHQSKAKAALSTQKEVSKRGLFNPFKSESVMNEAKYDIGMARKGNGLTVYNKAEEENGDYKNVAHIDSKGKIKYYDKKVPSNIKKQIEAEAKKMMEITKEGTMKLKDILKESFEKGKVYSNPFHTPFVKENDDERREESSEMSNEQKQAFLEAVKAYKSFGETVYRNEGLSDVYESIRGLVESAGKNMVKETEGSFDGITVGRHVKRMNESFKIFEKTLREVGTLQQRLESTYDEIGEVLGKYYEINETEEKVEEGNEFGAARAKAIANGDSEFEVDGKKFPVKDVSKDDKENAKKFANESVLNERAEPMLTDKEQEIVRKALERAVGVGVDSEPDDTRYHGGNSNFAFDGGEDLMLYVGKYEDEDKPYYVSIEGFDAGKVSDDDAKDFKGIVTAAMKLAKKYKKRLTTESKSMKLTSMLNESFGYGELPSEKLMKMKVSAKDMLDSVKNKKVNESEKVEEEKINEGFSTWEMRFSDMNLSGVQLSKKKVYKVKARNTVEAIKKAAKMAGVGDSWMATETHSLKKIG